MSVRPLLARLSLVPLLAGLCAPDAVAQSTPLGAASAAFPEDFGAIQTVRELPGGRVLVADPLGKALYRVDLDAGTRTVVGGEGQGPGEYLQPDAVWPLPGDSTLLIDLGNGRIVGLGPDLEFGPTMPIAMSEPRPGATLVLALPRGVDKDGRIYTRAMGGMRGGLPDSAAVIRIDRGTKAADTVTMVKLGDRTQTESGGPNNRSVQIENIPLSAEDAWGVAADGSVVVARSADYHVEWIAPDGSVTAGPPVDVDRIRIGTAEKEEWVREQGRSGGGIGIGIEVNNGSVQMRFARAGGGGREIDRYEWPDRKPPFYAQNVLVDPSDRAWVRRHVDAGESPTYDVFDRSGDRVGTVTLEGARQIVGFGAGTVYVVAYDDFDLNYLERYLMPAL